MKRIHRIPAPKLEVRDLRLLLALQQGHTTKAAGTLLHLAQPSVSRALLSLEERVGTPLFTRTSQGLQPTPAGMALTAKAEPLLQALCALEAEVSPAPPRRIRLVSECHAAYRWLPRALGLMHQTMPQLELSLRIEYTSDPIAALKAYKVDAALLNTTFRRTPEYRVESLFEDEMVFVVGVAHPLARQKTLTAKDLEAHRLLLSRSTPGQERWFLKAVFGRRKPKLRASYVPLSEAIAGLCREGLGIGLLTEWVAEPYLAEGGLVQLRLADERLARPWHLAWHRDLGEAGPLLRSALQQLKPD